VWWLAVLSCGESWHNLHHADPTCARHGVDRWQLDSSARLIGWFEKAGWVYDVRWPRASRLDAKRTTKPDGPEAGRPAGDPADNPEETAPAHTA
jgi:stearoyl-CoA desaturase (delta-9 desaturase)